MRFKIQVGIIQLISLVAITSCGESEVKSPDLEGFSYTNAEIAEPCDSFDSNRIALFGDLHVHTNLSHDSAANATGTTPLDANRYAQGETIPMFPLDASGKPIGRATIDRPLDFLAVTDHGEFLGERALCTTPGSPAFDSAFCTTFRVDGRQGMLMLASVLTTESPQRLVDVCGEDGELCREYSKTPWQEIQMAANQENSPCRFTSFVGYEYTGTPGTSNYHRNVIFRNSTVPKEPISYIDAPIDSKLWSALNKVCPSNSGCDYITIPHNTNLANGRMAPYMKIAQDLESKSAYAITRLKREPIMEIFQHKGGSECINGLSSVIGAPDELCDIEAVRILGENKTYIAPDESSQDLLAFTQASQITKECENGVVGDNGMLGAGCVDPTDFHRSALLVGLKEEQTTGFNPIKLGVIGSTDTHVSSAGNVKESSWVGAVVGEGTSLERLEKGILTSGIDGNPGGLAGVWAEENTRDSIFDALLRKEVFGTSGPRIRPRFFAGWDIEENLCAAPDMIEGAYDSGVPMGGDIKSSGGGKNLKFLMQASKDPDGLGIETLQLITGWIDSAGAMRTSVIPVISEKKGADSLCKVFSDSDFDRSLPSYYYMRVIEPESRRWHTFDCDRILSEQRPSVCSDGTYSSSIREMAWTSPIWYRPN